MGAAQGSGAARPGRVMRRAHVARGQAARRQPRTRPRRGGGRGGARSFAAAAPGMPPPPYLAVCLYFLMSRICLPHIAHRPGGGVRRSWRTGSVRGVVVEGCGRGWGGAFPAAALARRLRRRAAHLCCTRSCGSTCRRPGGSAACRSCTWRSCCGAGAGSGSGARGGGGSGGGGNGGAGGAGKNEGQGARVAAGTVDKRAAHECAGAGARTLRARAVRGGRSHAIPQVRAGAPTHRA